MRDSISLLLAFSLGTGFIYAESEPIQLEETVVTATLSEKKASDVPATIQTVDSVEIQEKRLPRTMPEVFKEMNGVLVQKTGHAQGSPFIRGFTSYHNVFLIDGIKLNNSVFRSGPNQYWGTVDPYSMDKIELLSGPASTLYGSDAVGGTVQAFTKGLKYNEDQNPWQGGVFTRFSSAEDSQILRFDLDGGLKENTDFHFGGSFKEFGDLESGAGELPNTGYDEYGFDIKLNHYFSEEVNLTIAHNRTKIDDAWRTHKTTSAVPFVGSKVGSEHHRILDQERALSYLQIHFQKANSLFDQMSFNISLHSQDEEQDRLRTNKGDLKNDFQGFEVDTLGLWTRFQKSLGSHLLSYGIERYSDSVDTYKYENNLSQGTSKTSIQGAFGDDSEYDTTGLYVQLDAELSKKWNVILGSRYTKTELFAGKVQDENGNHITISNDADAIVSNLKGIYNINNYVNVFAGISQSFRAPNLSDLTASFDAKDNHQEIPVTHELDPEEFLTFDFGIKIDTEDLQAGLTLFRTDSDGMITRTPTGAIDPSTGNKYVTKTNSSESYVQGLDLYLDKQLNKSWLLGVKTAWMDGENEYYLPKQASVVKEPVSRLLPFTTQLHIYYEKPGAKWWSELRVSIVSKQDNLATNDQDDTSRIPPGGTPGYEVYTLRGGYRFNEKMALSLAVENLFDENYRVHGSGLNEPGRNAILGMNYNF